MRSPSSCLQAHAYPQNSLVSENMQYFLVIQLFIISLVSILYACSSGMDELNTVLAQLELVTQEGKTTIVGPTGLSKG